MVESLANLLTQIESLRETSRSTTAKEKEVWGAIQTSISEGRETTGDPVKDFVLVSYGPHHNEKTLDAVRSFTEKFVGRAGQPALLVYGREESSRHSFMPERNPETHTVFGYNLGILREDPRLDVKSKAIVFPTGSADNPHYAQYNSGSLFNPASQKWVLEKGDMRLGPDDIASFLPPPGISFFEGLSGIERFKGVYFGGDIRNRTLRDEGISYFDDITYAQGLLCLGAPLPQEVQTRYDQHILARRMGVLERLQPFFASDVDLSSTPTRELTGEARSALREALELGLHKDTDVLTPRPGVSVELGPYIKDICQRYSIPLPS